MEAEWATILGVVLGGVIAALAGLGVALVQGAQAKSVEEARVAHDMQVRHEERRLDRLEQVYLDLLDRLADEDRVDKEGDAALKVRLDAYGSYDVRLAYVEWRSHRLTYRKAWRRWERLREAGGAAADEPVRVASEEIAEAGADMTTQRDVITGLVRNELGSD